MEPHQNVAIMKRAYDAFNTGDINTLTELMDETVWHLPGRSSMAGNYHGRGFCEASRRNRARHFPKRRGRNDFGNTTVEEFDRFLKTFSTKGALTRCRVTPRFAGASKTATTLVNPPELTAPGCSPIS